MIIKPAGVNSGVVLAENHDTGKKERLKHTGMSVDVVIMTGGNAPVNRRLEDSPRTEAERRGCKIPYDRPDPSG